MALYHEQFPTEIAPRNKLPEVNHLTNHSDTTIFPWLVVWTPLKNISQLGWLFENKIHVPNHQPVPGSITQQPISTATKNRHRWNHYLPTLVHLEVISKDGRDRDLWTRRQGLFSRGIRKERSFDEQKRKDLWRNIGKSQCDQPQNWGQWRIVCFHVLHTWLMNLRRWCMINYSLQLV